MFSDHIRSTEDLRDGKCPIDLIVYPRVSNKTADGFIYLDDGKTLEYAKNVRRCMWVDQG